MIDSNELERHLGQLGRPRVLIVGDLIMDRYIMGEVGRISPEAPIPVLAAKSSELRLGGAGNVAANLRAMDADVGVIGVVGDDGHGRAMQEMLNDGGIDTDHVVVDATRPTIEKTRMMSGVQQMLRVDWEDARGVDGDVLAGILERVPSAVAAASAVILSDYGKGTLTPEVIAAVVRAGRASGVPVLVDPKGTDYARYAGATLITPNKKEAETALGEKIKSLDALPDAADRLIAEAQLDLVIITLGAEGIYFRTRANDGESRLEGRVPALARAVYDVTGAGDTVVAQLALYLASGLELEVAVSLANHAAGIVVERLGTHSVTRTELAARLKDELPKIPKILDDDSLRDALEEWRRAGKRIVFTNGCFDVLHLGHVQYLRFARSKGDLLLVGVNDDASVRRLKGDERPVNVLADRMGVLAALEMVDGVVAFGEDTPKELVECVTPDVLVKGEDYADKVVVGREWVESHGGQVVLAPLVQGRSTTEALRKARGGAGVEGA
ncbi:MAG: D-glycero-beta-D-manno-heptose-7-phosphate kinase [bacterium]|nr:D-glycero-beta-D-manno-heptose-7-phosphate kinase [bacterium]